MITTIITAIIAYIATSLDEIPILFLLYKKSSGKNKNRAITAGYFTGTFLLMGLGLAGAFGLIQLPQKWMVGLIGLVPLFLGIKVLVTGDDDDEKRAASVHKYASMWIQVLVMTIALGVDDLGVYIPLFTTFEAWDWLLMLVVAAVGTALLCFISFRLTYIDRLSAFIEKQERYIVSLVFILIGIYVMLECQTYRIFF